MLAMMNLRSIDKESMRKRWKISIIAVTMKALTAMAIKSLGLIFSICGVNARDPERRSIRLVMPATVTAPAGAL